MKHTVSFSADLSTVAYAHSGDTAVFELHLSALDSSGKQHLFASGSLSTVQGQTTTFAPANWQDLTTVGVTNSTSATAGKALFFGPTAMPNFVRVLEP